MAKARLIKKSKRAKNTKISHQSIKNATRKNSLMKLNHFIANGYVTAVLTVLIDIIIFFGITYLCNVGISFLSGIPVFLQHKGEKMTPLAVDFGIHHMFDYVGSRWYYLIFAIILLLWDIRFIYRIQTAYRDLNKDQKGGERWTTLQEIQSQYKSIPMRAETVTETFPGQGGIPVCHYNGRIYIDDEPVNNLIVGITRSGKGEMFVFSLIDIYSRAQEKASLIIADPKLELASASYDTLVARGYDVHILNLTEELDSMGYNPLSLIVDAYREEDFSTAEMLCQTFCYSIFNSEEKNNGENQFFYINATFLLSALIIAHVEDCIALDKEENRRRKAEYDAGLRAYQELSEKEQESCINTFDKIAALEQKKESSSLPEYKKISKAIEKLKESVVGITDVRVPFKETHENEKKVNMYSIINTFQELQQIPVDEQGTTTILDVYFNSRPDYDRAKLLFASVGSAGGQRTKGSIYSTMLSELMLFTYEKLAKLTAESSFDLEDIGYGDKPVAIFLGTPDYDHSKDFLLSVFIKQTSFLLSKRASLSPSGKCDREVIYILDEFGNIPAIEGMDSLVTVCLGRNIRFNLIVQSYSQIEATYGDKAATIIGNCGNQIYIQSADKSTTELFSALIGNETITNINRIGDKMSLKKSFTELPDEKPLINPNELQELLVGECVIKRVMKRKDLRGNDIPPFPICNRGELKFPYRYMYLSDYFPSGVDLKHVNKEHRDHICHTDRVFDVKKYISDIITKESTTLTVMERQKRWEIIKDIYLQELIENPLLADYCKEIQDANMKNYQWSSDAVLNFYEKNENTFNLTKEQFLECSPAEIRYFLQDKNPPLAVGFYNITTDDSFLPLPENEQETAPAAAEDGTERFQTGEELDSTDIQYLLEKYRQDNTLINDLPDCRKIAEMIYKVADKDLLDENDITDVFDIFDLSLKSILQSGFIPAFQEKYLVIAIENAKKGDIKI